MSSAKLQEIRSKSLCYNYNDKWNPGHGCKKIFLIEACTEEINGDAVMENDEDDSTATPAISLHAIFGIRAPETMRVTGRLRREATILIDSGRTHNFISENLAQRVGLKSHLRGRLEVAVTSGEKVSSTGKCSNVKMSLQDISLYVDFFSLPLEGYDVVLGAEWLQMLEPITWDFSKLQMKFKMGGKHIKL
ncbi:hypothetical protein AMTRI_Chr13g121170 [Amborella trichopoda]